MAVPGALGSQVHLALKRTWLPSALGLPKCTWLPRPGNRPSYIITSRSAFGTLAIILPTYCTIDIFITYPRLQPYLSLYSYTRPYTYVRPYRSLQKCSLLSSEKEWEVPLHHLCH